MGGKITNESVSDRHSDTFVLVDNIKLLESNIEYKFLGLKLKYVYLFVLLIENNLCIFICFID